MGKTLKPPIGARVEFYMYGTVVEEATPDGFVKVKVDGGRVRSIDTRQIAGMLRHLPPRRLLGNYKEKI